MLDIIIFFEVYCFFFSLVLLSLYNFSKIDYDWDLPAYIGCVMKKSNDKTPLILHQNVYLELKERLSDREYLQVIGINETNQYRNFVSKDADSYYQQLRYYDIKVLYIDSVWIINFFINQTITSIYLLNAICFVLFGFLIFKILFKFCNLSFFSCYLITLSICILPVIANLARIASPDLMVFVLILFLCYSFFNGFNYKYQIFITLLIVGTRPDYILFTVLYLILIFFIEKKIIYYVLPIGVLCNFAFYFCILYYYNYPGWESLFYDTFIHRRLNISTELAVLNFQDYWNVLVRNVYNFKKIGLISLILLGLSYFLVKQKKIEKYNFFLILLMFFSLYFKYLFFPASGEIRFFIIYLLMMGLCILNPKRIISI